MYSGIELEKQIKELVDLIKSKKGSERSKLLNKLEDLKQQEIKLYEDAWENRKK